MRRGQTAAYGRRMVFTRTRRRIFWLIARDGEGDDDLRGERSPQLLGRATHSARWRARDEPRSATAGHRAARAGQSGKTLQSARTSHHQEGAGESSSAAQVSSRRVAADGRVRHCGQFFLDMQGKRQGRQRYVAAPGRPSGRSPNMIGTSRETSRAWPRPERQNSDLGRSPSICGEALDTVRKPVSTSSARSVSWRENEFKVS